MIAVRRMAFRGVLLAVLLAGISVQLLRPSLVLEHEVARGVVLVEALGSGALESRRVVDLGFEVTGRIARITADQGDRVEAGAVLAVLDDETFRADVAAAHEDVRYSEAGLRRLEAEQSRADAVLAGASAHLRRVRELHQTQVAAQQALDEAQERLGIAEAELERARAARTEGQQRLAMAQRSLERAQALLARTVAHSPFAALVLRREREAGDVAVPGAAVLRLASTDGVWASVWVDETYLGALRQELPARVLLRSTPDRPLAGRVARIGREVDRETRELLVDIAFEAMPERFAIGQRVDAWIELASLADVVRLPPEYIVRHEGKPAVFVLEAGRARLRPLELGARGRAWVEVPHGLEPGERCVRPPRPEARLADGERVHPDGEPGP